MQIKETKLRGTVLQSQLLSELPGIEHFSSTKATHEAEKEVWMPRQVHGTQIVTPQPTMPEADAVITSQPGQWIGVRTADCVPVLLYDPQRKVVAAIHAGWRGTVKHIVRLTIEKMIAEFECQPDGMYAMIGPSISPEAFEVGDEVVQAFREADRSECIIAHPYGKAHIDLWQSNVMDMMEAGLALDHIDCTPICTYQNTDALYSARREGIDTGRIVTAIRLTSE